MTALALIGLAGCWLLFACLLIIPVARFFSPRAFARLQSDAHDEANAFLSLPPVAVHCRDNPAREHADPLGPLAPLSFLRSHEGDI